MIIVDKASYLIHFLYKKSIPKVEISSQDCKLQKSDLKIYENFKLQEKMEAKTLILKHAFYIFSIASTLAGVLFIWFGLSLLPRLSFLNIDPNAVLTLSAVGAGLTVITLIGIYGAIRRSYIPILLHGIFHSGIFCYSITIMLFIWIKMKPFIKRAIHEAFIEKFTNNFLIVNSTMDVIQSSYQCCGKYSALDYLTEAPPSCFTYNECAEGMALNSIGCVPAVMFNLHHDFFLAKFAVVVVIFLEFLTVIASLAYSNALKAKSDQTKDLLVAELLY